MDTKQVRPKRQGNPEKLAGEKDNRQPPSRYWELIHASGKLFAEKGYHAASVRDIASAVGMTSGSFFYHFETKEDVLIAVLEFGMNEGAGIVRNRLENAHGARQRLRALVLGHLEALHSEYSYAHKVWMREWRQIPPEKRTSLDGLRQEYRDIWSGVLEEVKAEGLISSDPTFFYRLAIGAINWTVHWLHEPTPAQLEDLSEEFTRAFLNEGTVSGSAVKNGKKRA